MTESSDRIVRWAGAASLAVSVAVLAVKLAGYFLTGSQAVLSDALESVVNVVAAGVALIVVRYAAAPADVEHPYGHGKTEFFSAAFEGGLITLAAVLIVLNASYALVVGHTVSELGIGSALVLCAALLNFALGAVLLRVGTSHHSITLTASGHHVISDVWTSAAAVLGLGAVKLTGINALDPAVAIVMGVWLGRTGLRIVRQSVGGLMDEHAPESLEALARAVREVIESNAIPGIIGVHGARLRQAGRYHYIDAHVVVPEYWDVRHAHDEVNRFERAVIMRYDFDGEIHFHIDPCRVRFCAACAEEACPIRQKPFERRVAVTAEELLLPETRVPKGASRAD